MSNGIVVNGDGNSLLFSTETKGLFFEGKASFYQVYSSETADYQYNNDIGIIYSLPKIIFYEYRITLPSSVQTILPFIYNPVGKRVAIVNTRKLDSTTWEILTVACTNPNEGLPVISSTTYIPSIYVFSDTIDAAANVGNGINVFGASGNVVFTTNERPLIIKGYYSGQVPYSALVTSGAYDGRNGPDRTLKTITWFNPASSLPAISKPALYYSSNQTCRINSTGFIDVFDSTAVLEGGGTGRLGIEWANSARFYSPGDPTQQSTVTPFFALLIDGAQYD